MIVNSVRLHVGGIAVLAAVVTAIAAESEGRHQAVNDAASAVAIQPTGLRCEYLIDPLGIDVPRPRLSWISESASRGQRQTAYRILVSSRKELLAQDQGDLWDSGKVLSDRSTHVSYAGDPLRSRMQCYWKLRVWDRDGRPSPWSPPAQWTMGLLAAEDWQAKWITAPQSNEPPKVSSSPWLRRTFVLDSIPKRATVYVASVGYHELYLNGEKVSDHVLSPAVSNYRHRALYVTHDVTADLVAGENCIAVWLGRGWAAHRPYRLKIGPAALVQLEAVLPDGKTVRVCSDEHWKANPSPITNLGEWRFNRFGGERYDARREVPDWNSTRLDDSSWLAATACSAPVSSLSAQMIRPDRRVETISPVGVRALADGVYVVDMGRCFTGWIELRLKGPSDRTVTFDYSERPVSAPGTRTFNQYDEYICSGKGPEVFHSRFNYHGFRWVTITGLDEQPRPEDIRGYLIHTDFAPAGEFACSDEQFNRIYQTTLWTYRCLSLGGYVVDCPHRERLGYGAEGQVAVESALFNFRQGAFFTKWLCDWRDVQDPETGEVPHTAPTYIGGGGPAWGGIVVTLPWQLYRHYGDTQVLETCYPMMQRYLQWLDTKLQDNLLQPWGGEWDFLADWVAPGRNRARPIAWTPEPLRQCFNNCYLVHITRLAGKIAAVLGKEKDAVQYRKKADAICAATHAAFFNPQDNTYANGEQPYLALPLLVGMVPQPLREKVMANLERDILNERQGHVNAGVLGTWLLLKFLVKENRNDLIFPMAQQTDYPSWGHMLDLGATTFWERWNGEESLIHTSFLSIGSWFTEGLAGIQPDEETPGFKHFFIRPSVVGNLTWARARYDSIHGTILSHWRIEGDRFQLQVQIPVNTTATIQLPARERTAVLESGQPADKAPGVRFVRREGQTAVYRIGSGSYLFESRIAP